MSGVQELSLLDEYISWLEEWGRSPATIKTYKSIINQFFESGYPLTTEGVNRFLSKYKGNSRALAYFAIRSFFRFLEARGMRLNIAWDLIPRRWVQPERPALTREQLRRVLSNCRNLREKVIVSLMYDLALRVSELTELRWGDLYVDDDGVCWVETRRLKRGRRFAVPLDPDTCRYVLEWRQMIAETQGIRPDDRIVDVTPRMVQMIIKSIGRRAGIELHSHIFRRSRATHLSEEGWDIVEIAELGGWRSIQTVMRYVKVPQARIASKKIAKYNQSEGSATE